jgi:hypothetical protein
MPTRVVGRSGRGVLITRNSMSSPPVFRFSE